MNASAGDGSAPQDERVERAERVIAAPAHVIFELLADPAQHARIDGSGSVQGVRDGSSQRLALGTKFSMDMKIGVPYRMRNEVVEFEEDRRLAWRHMGGHVWRYVLEPIDDHTTARRGGVRLAAEQDAMAAQGDEGPGAKPRVAPEDPGATRSCGDRRRGHPAAGRMTEDRVATAPVG